MRFSAAFSFANETHLDLWITGSFDFNRTLNRYGSPVSGFLYCPGSVSDSANTSLWLLSIDCVLRISSLSSVRMLAPSFLGFVPSGLGSVVFGNPGLVHTMLSLFCVSDSLYVVLGVFTVFDFLGSLPGPATFMS